MELNQLERKWGYWYRLKDIQQGNDWQKSLKLIESFQTVEQFWSIYQHLHKPNTLPPNAEYFVFIDGIKPMWEDEFNKNGGKWSLRLQKGVVGYFWEELLLHMIGEQFPAGSEICGITVSVRSHEDIISIWIKNAQDYGSKMSVRDSLKQIWKLSEKVHLEYKDHPTNQKNYYQPHYRKRQQNQYT